MFMLRIYEFTYYLAPLLAIFGFLIWFFLLRRAFSSAQSCAFFCSILFVAVFWFFSFSQIKDLSMRIKNTDCSTSECLKQSLGFPHIESEETIEDQGQELEIQSWVYTVRVYPFQIRRIFHIYDEKIYSGSIRDTHIDFF